MKNKLVLTMGNWRSWLWRHRKEITLTRIFKVIAIIGILVGLGFTAFQTWTLHSDYVARTRPYLAVETVWFRTESDNSVFLNIHVTNYGGVPATNLELHPTSVKAGEIGSGKDLVIIDFTGVGTHDRCVFQGKGSYIELSISGDDYEKAILATEALTIGFSYSSGKTHYSHEAYLTLRPGGDWRVDFERCW